ncbi:MAG: multidrug effflux MFS transporter [Betaproteobacteria bacterium]|nr:multidrug effflux MFS transporter [Betaproteobacteria bacterium]
MAALLAALAMIGPFSIDTYLPAFPAIGASLGASPVAVQQTLTAYLVPFALMIMWHGALSDALGRRRVILVGLALYVLASLFCVFATRIEYLWFGRALQGLCAGVGIVVSRAIVRDLLDGPAAQRLMARISMMFALGPALAPIIGGWIHAFFDWHAIFVFMALFGAVLWLAVQRWLPETLPKEKRQSLHPVHLWHAYRSVFGHAEFMSLSAALSLNFLGMFIYVLSSPVFLTQHLGISPQGFAWLFVPCVGGLVIGSYISGRLAGRLSPRRTIALGYIVMCLAAAANLAMNMAFKAQVPWAILPFPIYTIGMSMAVPSLQLLALDLFPEKRGLASSCQGVMQTGSSAFAAAILAPLLWGTPLTLAGGMAGFLLLGLCVFAIAIWHYRAPQRASRQ